MPFSLHFIYRWDHCGINPYFNLHHKQQTHLRSCLYVCMFKANKVMDHFKMMHIFHANTSTLFNKSMCACASTKCNVKLYNNTIDNYYINLNVLRVLRLFSEFLSFVIVQSVGDPHSFWEWKYIWQVAKMNICIAKISLHTSLSVPLIFRRLILLTANSS